MSAGSGIGMIVMSPVVEKILTVYDWRGALIIMAGLLLQLCVATSTTFETFECLSQREITWVTTMYIPVDLWNRCSRIFTIIW
jgi:hypothetical protein